jgi:hypothetical protein
MHAQAYKISPNADLIGVSDVMEARAKEIAKALFREEFDKLNQRLNGLEQGQVQKTKESFYEALNKALILADGLSVKAAEPVQVEDLNALQFILGEAIGQAADRMPDRRRPLFVQYSFRDCYLSSFAMFFLAEYINMVTVSAVATDLFLGGWQGPLLPPFVWFVLKSYFVVFILIWIRWTLPRFPL